MLMAEQLQEAASDASMKKVIGHKRPKEDVDDSGKTSEEQTVVKPKRPLTAYNFFFQIERAKLLGIEPPTNNVTPRVKKRRKHRKTHGQFTFTQLSQHISRKWKSLDDSARAEYLQKQEDDKERYKMEVVVYNEQLKSLGQDVESSESGDDVADASMKSRVQRVQKKACKNKEGRKRGNESMSKKSKSENSKKDHSMADTNYGSLGSPVISGVYKNCPSISPRPDTLTSNEIHRYQPGNVQELQRTFGLGSASKLKEKLLSAPHFLEENLRAQNFDEATRQQVLRNLSELVLQRAACNMSFDNFSTSQSCVGAVAGDSKGVQPSLESLPRSHLNPIFNPQDHGMLPKGVVQEDIKRMREEICRLKQDIKRLTGTQEASMKPRISREGEEAGLCLLDLARQARQTGEAAHMVEHGYSEASGTNRSMPMQPCVNTQRGDVSVRLPNSSLLEKASDSSQKNCVQTSSDILFNQCFVKAASSGKDELKRNNRVLNDWHSVRGLPQASHTSGLPGNALLGNSSGKGGSNSCIHNSSHYSHGCKEQNMMGLVNDRIQATTAATDAHLTQTGEKTQQQQPVLYAVTLVPVYQHQMTGSTQ